MIDRLRFLLDRPLDPLAARAVVIFATAILLGFGAVFVLGAIEGERPAPPRERVSPPRLPQLVPSAPAGAVPPSRRDRSHPSQDPQDEIGSAAHRRAETALRSHRALQHVPYRQGGVEVWLVGVRKGRALLRVSASTIQAARDGWRRFLLRFDDPGGAYVPLFAASGRGPRGGR